jgi:hypothetical protein
MKAETKSRQQDSGASRRATVPGRASQPALRSAHMQRFVTAKAHVVARPISSLPLDLPFVTQQASLFQRIWPMAALAAAAIVNLAWMCLLGYAFFKLVMWI